MTDGAHAVIRSCLSWATKATLAALIANVALIPPLFTQASASDTGMREALQRFLKKKLPLKRKEAVHLVNEKTQNQQFDALSCKCNRQPEERMRMKSSLAGIFMRESS